MFEHEIEKYRDKLIEHLTEVPVPICRQDIARILQIKEYKVAIILSSLLECKKIMRVGYLPNRAHLYNLFDDKPSTVEPEPEPKVFSKNPQIGVWGL